ncbi:MAG: hypothetical protein J3K34DRAFT_421690 [Monoraphidium minutum]|nr:MAG: hypothetical protein J3K34DRAFT_421690 [Monoraphidium minutum]
MLLAAQGLLLPCNAVKRPVCPCSRSGQRRPASPWQPWVWCSADNQPSLVAASATLSGPAAATGLPPSPACRTIGMAITQRATAHAKQTCTRPRVAGHGATHDFPASHGGSASMAHTAQHAQQRRYMSRDTPPPLTRARPRASWLVVPQLTQWVAFGRKHYCFW